MSTISLEEIGRIPGVQIGLAIALVPAAATLVIASSRIIVVNIIANIVLGLLSAGAYEVGIRASFVKVPFLWKVSLISAVIGGSIAILSLTAYLVNKVYLTTARGR